MYYPLLDITERIVEPPRWWLDGIPRYCDFHPQEATFSPANLLVRISCQQCQRTFDVPVGTRAALREGVVDPDFGYPLDRDTGEPIMDGHRDPPFHLGKDGFNCVGSTMIAEWVAILQAWERTGAFDYKRRADLEGLSPDSPL